MKRTVVPLLTSRVSLLSCNRGGTVCIGFQLELVWSLCGACVEYSIDFQQGLGKSLHTRPANGDTERVSLPRVELLALRALIRPVWTRLKDWQDLTWLTFQSHSMPG